LHGEGGGDFVEHVDEFICMWNEER
jgi:hypothetical protein